MKFQFKIYKSALYFAIQKSVPEVVHLLLERQDLKVNDTSIFDYCLYEMSAVLLSEI